MKSTLLSVISLFAVAFASAQCVPGTDFNGTGLTLSPAQLDPVFACNECGDREVIISVQTFADTTLAVELTPGNPPLDVTVFADFFRLDSIAGLPVGLTYTTDAAFDTTYDAVTNPFGYWINPGDTTNGFENTSGCISITGSAADWTTAASGGPNSDGLYPLTVFIDARAANFDPAAIGGFTGFNVWLTEMGVLLDAFGDPNFTVHGIKLEGLVLDVRESGLGINSQDVDDFGTVSNFPNPFSGSTTISYELLTDVNDLTLEVFNVLGSVVHSQKLPARTGQNKVEFRSNGLPSGVYFYNIESENGSVTRKMTIQ